MSKRGERGQSTLEFALLVPFVMIAVLALIQVALIAYSQLAVIHVAREVARTVVVDPTVDIGQITSGASVVGSEGLAVSVNFEDVPGTDVDVVSVSVSYEVPPISGLFAIFLADFAVRAEVKMLAET